MNNWPRLYALADRIKTLEPWNFMTEDEIIGVRDPVTGTIGFLSVMGRLGEHYSISIYLGERAFGQYQDVSDDGVDATPEMILEIPQLMLSFEEKEFLFKEDRTLMKDCGIKYSGNTLRPMFRSYRPGMVPWFLEEKEQESMVNYLEQFLEIMISHESNNTEIEPESDGLDRILVREYKQVGEEGKWVDTHQEIFIPYTNVPDVFIDSGLFDNARNTPFGKNIYEVDFFLTPAQVKEKNKRPFFSYALLIVDRQSEFVISMEVMDPSDGIDSMLKKIPGMLLKLFSQCKSLPAIVYTPSYRLLDLMSPIFDDLGIQIKFKPRLKSLEMAKSSIMDHFGPRGKA